MVNFYVDYSRGSYIESGSFGEVCRVIRKTDGIEFALKTIFKDKLPPHAFSSQQAKYPTEIELLRNLDHPHIIKYVDCFEDSKSFLLIMELVSNSIDLYDFTRRRIDTTEDVMAYLFSQIADAIHFLHCHDIAHMDIKLENVVMDENLNCKLVDFGSATICRDDELFHYPRCSEPSCSPEIWSGGSFYAKDADCWALGVLLYRLCYREVPFISRDEASSIRYMLPEHVSAELEDLFSRIFHETLQCRADAWEIRYSQWTRSGNGRGYTVHDFLAEEKTRESLSMYGDELDDYDSSDTE